MFFTRGGDASSRLCCIGYGTPNGRLRSRNKLFNFAAGKNRSFSLNSIAWQRKGEGSTVVETERSIRFTVFAIVDHQEATHQVMRVIVFRRFCQAIQERIRTSAFTIDGFYALRSEETRTMMMINQYVLQKTLSHVIFPAQIMTIQEVDCILEGFPFHLMIERERRR